MKRLLLAAGVALGIFATTTANTNYGTPRDYKFSLSDTTPKKDTTRKDTTGRKRDSLNMPSSFQR